MRITRNEIENLIKECNLTKCFECGKCTAICPMGEFYGDIEFGSTPRAIIDRALLNQDLFTGEALWYCLTCSECTKGCPSGVCFRDFMEGLRKLMIQKGHNAYVASCNRCGSYFLSSISQKHLFKKLGPEADAPKFLFTCPLCRRKNFFDIVKQNLPVKH